VQVAIDLGLCLCLDKHTQLISSETSGCDAPVFPRESHCPNCGKPGASDLLLPRRRTIVTWTRRRLPLRVPSSGPSGNELMRFEVGLVQPGGTDAYGKQTAAFAFMPVLVART
jgi:uncharacterized OB-fold protein